MSNFESQVYFGTPIWGKEIPEYVKSVNKVCDKYIKEAQKNNKNSIKERNKFYKRKLGDFSMSHHSTSLYKDPELKDFVEYCGNRSYEFLDSCGFDLTNHSLHYTEMWVQEFSKKGGGHHNTHAHTNQHVSGFYYLKASDKTSYPVFHDPRPGALMTKLPPKDLKKISHASEMIHYQPKPGLMVIIPGYLPHQYIVDLGIEPFRFIHWNIQCVPKNISNASNNPKT